LRRLCLLASSQGGKYEITRLGDAARLSAWHHTHGGKGIPLVLSGRKEDWSTMPLFMDHHKGV
ncbi:MAG TPA: hypothetical protein VG127_01220, partial [Rubrobacteraceae bacterium]|nr:hypothetical protein [Rubrobacteraceae bacterium]